MQTRDADAEKVAQQGIVGMPLYLVVALECLCKASVSTGRPFMQRVEKGAGQDRRCRKGNSNATHTCLARLCFLGDCIHVCLRAATFIDLPYTDSGGKGADRNVGDKA